MIGPVPDDSVWSSVRRHAPGPAILAVVATIGFVSARLELPEYSGLALRLYVFGIGVACLWLTLAVISGLHGSNSRLEIERALRRPTFEHRRPVRLEEIESQVRFALSSALDYDHRLRPLLRELAAERMGTSTEDARARLGDGLWHAVYGEQPSGDRDSPGPTLAMLRSLIDAVESS